MSDKPTVADIVRGLKPFVRPGEVYELRILDCVDNPKYGKFTMFGYYDSDHLDDLAKAALAWTPNAVGVYVTMNPVNPDLLARAANRVIRAGKDTKSTSDGDIVARRRLTIDFDPERPAGISSTDEEKVRAAQLCWTVRQDLHSLGWPEPIEADSGNGYHLNYAVDLPADDGGLVERFLKALSAKHSTPAVKVDESLFNQSRIIKLYGTLSQKGDSIPSRPHRLAKVISAPMALEVVEKALIEAFTQANPPPEPEAKQGKVKPPQSKPESRKLTKGGKVVWDLGVTSRDFPDWDLRPGDDFEAREEWSKILEPHGWTIDAELSNGEVRWTRPGKNGGTSATTGHNAGLKVFTDSKDATPFNAGQNYSKFEAYTLLNHGGSYKASVPALIQLAYGRYIDNGGEVKQNPPPQGWKREGGGNAVPYKDPPLGTPRDYIEANSAGVTEFDPASIKWKGEPRPVRAVLLAVPSLPEDLIPDQLRPWLNDIAERVSCPLDFAVVPALVALGVVLGRKIRMRPKAHDVWTVIPNPWGAIIGRPGVLKSPPLKEALLPLRRLEVEAREIFEREQTTYESRLVVKDIEQKVAKASIQEAIKAKKPKAHIEKLTADLSDIIPPDVPVQRRYTTSDATMEALGPLLAQHGHIGILRDELTGWFRSLERSDQGTAKAFCLELYDGLGDLYQFDRIGRGYLPIKGGTGQVLGGIQPGPWRSLLRAILQDAAADDGMISRLSLLVWPDVTEWRNVDRWPDTKAKNTAFEIYQKLANFSADQFGAKVDEYGSGMPYLKFDDEAQELFNVWRNNLEVRLRTNDESPLLESHLAKYRKLMPQMAFMSHMVAAVTGGLTGSVASEHAVRGLNWCEYLEKHARRAYAIGSDQDIEPALALAEKIKGGSLPSPFTSREVYRHHWSNLDDPRLVGCAIAVLEDHNWLTIVETKQAMGAPREDVHIHPSLPRKALEK